MRKSGRHRHGTAYYREMGISEDFYWFTLQAAPSAGIHNMTRAEIDRLSLDTETER